LLLHDSKYDLLQLFVFSMNFTAILKTRFQMNEIKVDNRTQLILS